MGNYTAPRYYGPLTQMGAQLVADGRKTGRSLIAEGNGAALKDTLQDRTTIGGKQNMNPQLRAERKEIGNRARILRMATYNYLAQWHERAIFKEESTRARRFRESSQDDVDRMGQQVYYVPRKS